MRLHQKRCLIVGGTSGIGLAAGRQFVAEGARLVVVGREPSEGDGWLTLAADVTDPAAVERCFAAAIAHLGGLDVLYHVAGSSGRRHGDGSLHECSDAGWRATVDANLTSVFLTNRAAVRHFLNHGGGVILNMASVLAIDPSPRYFDTCAYIAAKGGIIAMSRAAAARYAAEGIRINVLAPGLIDTPMAARAVQDEAISRFLHTKQPLAQGPGQPDDCGGAAVFLCSDEARFITGTILPVDGGWCVSEGQVGISAR